MTDNQINNLIETVNGNTKAINRLHVAIIGLIDAMCDGEGGEGDDSKKMTTYLNGAPIAE